MDIKFDQSSFDVSLVDDGDGFLDLDYTKSDAEDLMQRLFLRFKTYPRDLFWNIGYGIDYLNTVFGRNRPKRDVDIIIRNELNKEPMVKEILSFESEIKNYTYGCKFRVSVVESQTEASYYIITNENSLILTNEDGKQLVTRL